MSTSAVLAYPFRTDFSTMLTDCDQIFRCTITEVIQTSILKEFSIREAKALIGFEVGRVLLQRLPTFIPGGFINPLADLYLVCNAYLSLQKATRPKPGLAGAPPWIRDVLADHERFSFKRPD